MTKQAVIFDLDGTLIDSGIVILRIINRMRLERGGSAVELHDVRPHLSKGGFRLVRESLGHLCADGDDDLALFRQYYFEEEQGEDILYENVKDMLSALLGRGFVLGICTNKPSLLCKQALEQTGLLSFFSSVVSAGESSPAKPDPHAYLQVCRELAVEPHATILVGDSEVDRDTAKAVGAQFILVTYGYPIGDVHDIAAAARCHAATDIVRQVHDVQNIMIEDKVGEPVT